eukprot:CAMPEP_0114489254 /NCGR_PEP_ID=MMETSP0109-20121206/1790_1 /TAXON_ID=29199 /ORGANISM="Chlorarachnion reptans, Strain CCCM449" /LENGTH=69 /DNA_ID=CAMNT_0001665751 /DNA_START=314 /DNA_END=523 /DNA_ORIENTATION=-
MLQRPIIITSAQILNEVDDDDDYKAQIADAIIEENGEVIDERTPSISIEEIVNKNSNHSAPALNQLSEV